jgi:hypothetical protein
VLHSLCSSLKVPFHLKGSHQQTCGSRTATCLHCTSVFKRNGNGRLFLVDNSQKSNFTSQKHTASCWMTSLTLASGICQQSTSNKFCNCTSQNLHNTMEHHLLPFIYCKVATPPSPPNGIAREQLRTSISQTSVGLYILTSCVFKACMKIPGKIHLIRIYQRKCPENAKTVLCA